MFESVRQYICDWRFVEALHFWIEIGQCVTLGLLMVLVVKLWKHHRRVMEKDK
jgi:hypothetical protein